jgi:hypothetical protein
MEPASLTNWSIGIAAGVNAGVLATMLYRLRSFEMQVRTGLSRLSIPFALASEQGLLHIYQRFSNGITQLSGQSDPLLRELALFKLSANAEEVESLARGTITFPATETWRTAYEKLLMTLTVKSYYSVAWVRSSDYWNDTPGRQSMQLNYDLAERGFHIERIHILPDHLWRWEDYRPAPEIMPWLDEQQQRRINVRLVREAHVLAEPDLLSDFAIYGNRATAVQELDEHSRTIRYVLSFDRINIRRALDRWDRLGLFAVSWADFLDHRKVAP